MHCPIARIKCLPGDTAWQQRVTRRATGQSILTSRASLANTDVLAV